MARKSAAEREQDILEEIGRNFNAWFSYYSQNLEHYRLDMNFTYVDQWDAKDRAEFKRLQKPMLTQNLVYDYVRKVIGEQRQAKQNLEARPLNEDATQQDVDLMSDIVRQIAFSSKSEIAYETAFETMIVGGFGGIRVVTEYESPKSFNQHIQVKRVENPERLAFDPNASEVTKRDGMFCGYYVSMSRKEFEVEYPNVPYPESFPMQSQIKEFNWGTRDNINVVEYYRKEHFEFSLYQLDNGQHVTDKEYKKIMEEYSLSQAQEGPEIPTLGTPPQIVNKRKTRDYKIMCYKAVYDKIIAKFEWPSKEFPLIFVPAHAAIVDGQERTISFVRFAKDAQRFYNYVKSETAQALKNNRREQFLVTPDNISGQGLEQMWRNPSVQQGALVAKPDPLTKQMPQRLPAPELPQSLIAQAVEAKQDIQSVLGLYESNRGAQGAEISGSAIYQRQLAGNLATKVFFDNIQRGIEQVGRVIMSLVPKIYDTERRFMRQTSLGNFQPIILNQEIAGDIKENDVTKGEYDVVLVSGPSYMIQRQEALELLMQMSRVNPQIFPLIADLIAENVDIENQPQLVERFRTLVPPNIIAQEEGRPPPPPQPNPQAMMMQQEMQLKQQELALKQQQQQLDAQKDMRQQQIDAAKTELDMQKLQMQQQMAQIKAGAELGKAKMDYDASIADTMNKIISERT